MIYDDGETQNVGPEIEYTNIALITKVVNVFFVVILNVEELWISTI